MNTAAPGVEVWNGEPFVFWSTWRSFDDPPHGLYNAGVAVDIQSVGGDEITCPECTPGGARRGTGPERLETTCCRPWICMARARHGEGTLVLEIQRYRLPLWEPASGESL